MTSTRNRSGTYNVRSLDATAGPIDAIALHWPEYLMEGLELGLFMIVACSAGTLLFYKGSPVLALFAIGDEQAGPHGPDDGVDRDCHHTFSLWKTIGRAF